MKPFLRTLSAADLAAILNVDRQTIYRMRSNGRLPRGFLIGRRIRRWSVDELITHNTELTTVLKSWANTNIKPANDNGEIS
jgi:predicted DNA-binding transcriptional regulator AlpA